MSCGNCGCDAPAPVEPGANGASHEDEEAVLTKEFGEPNQDGIYGAVVEE